MRTLYCRLLAAGMLALALVRPYGAYAGDSAAAKAKTYMSDSAVTTELKGKFLVEKGLDSMDIKVETTRGVVTLRGQVLKESQSALAEKIARETKGVRTVKNKISVMP